MPDVGHPARSRCSGCGLDPSQFRFPFNRMPASDARDWDAIHAWADELATVLHPSSPAPAATARPGSAAAGSFARSRPDLTESPLTREALSRDLLGGGFPMASACRCARESLKRSIRSDAIDRDGRECTMRKLLEIGGFIAGAVLIVFGAAAIVMGVNGRRPCRTPGAGADRRLGGHDPGR